MKKQYDNFLFDLYGTLVDIHTDEEKAGLWEDCAGELERQGVTAQPEALRDQYAEGVRTLEVRDRAARGPGAEIDLEPVFRGMLESGGKPARAEQVRDFAYVFRMASLEKLRLFPGAAELLKSIRRAGKHAYLLSNAQSLFTRPELDKLGLTELFDGILLSSEVGYKKPDPQFYRAMLEKYSLDPAGTVMIGNDDEADCRGAAAVGLDSCYVETEQSPALTRPLPENCRVLRVIADAMALVAGPESVKAEPEDAAALAPLVKKLWPEHSSQALVRILTEYIGAEESCVFACRENGRFVGVALCCLRHDYVEGCETSPVGYLEGIYVEESCRLTGTARALVGQCEQWAKDMGCREFASDCELTNTDSLAFHLRLGFTEENRIICFKKNL